MVSVVDEIAVQLESMDEPRRVALVREIAKTYRLRAVDLATHTGYSTSSVVGWLSPPDGARYRPVPVRALRLLMAEIAAGRVKKKG